MSRWTFHLVAGTLLLTAAGVGVALFVASDPPAGAGGTVTIMYPFDEALFPPEIPAPAFR